MLVVTALVIACLVLPSTPFTARDFLKDAVRGTWDSAVSNGCTLFFCSKEPQIALKDLSDLGFTVKIAQPLYWFDALDTVRSTSPQGLHTLVVDWQCPMADQLLRKASKLAIIRNPFRWLVLNVTEDEQTPELCQDLAAEISANGSALAEGKAADADVVLVCRGPSFLILVDLWGPTILGKWIPDVATRFQSDRTPPAARRVAAGFSGYVFRAAFVITKNDTYAHLNDGANKQYDYMTKMNYEICHILAKMLNGSLQVSFDDDWGFLVNGSWTGIIGQQVRGEAEIGGTPTAITYARLPAQTFLNYHTPVAGIFIFREPPMSYVYNIFTRPFPRSLWLAIIGLISLGAILLYGVLRVEELTGLEEHHNKAVVVDERKRRLDATWSDVAILTIGAVCQQGSPTEARGVPGRIVTLFLFLGILFLFTSYSASIVSLLQSTTSNIRHYKDFLLDSRIQLGAEDIIYHHHYMSNEKEPIRRQVYLKKLIKYGRRNPYMTLEKGMKKMRTSYFAFYGARPNLYQIIADTFQEHEKCGLREVENYLVVSNPQLTVSKWSTFAEVLRIALRRIQETGISHRQFRKFTPMRPVCVNQGGNFQSASLMDCYAAFIVLLGGFGISIFLLLLENAIFHRVSCVNRKH